MKHRATIPLTSYIALTGEVHYSIAGQQWMAAIEANGMRMLMSAQRTPFQIGRLMHTWRVAA